VSKGELLMTTDEKVELAQRIEGQLTGIIPSEWNKWCAYARRFGIKKAIQFAQIMQNSPSLRPGPKQSYRTISQVMGRFRKDLEKLSQDELAEVFGYVRRFLFARRGETHEERTRR